MQAHSNGFLFLEIQEISVVTLSWAWISPKCNAAVATKLTAIAVSSWMRMYVVGVQRVTAVRLGQEHCSFGHDRQEVTDCRTDRR